MGVRDYGSLNEIDTKIVQGENIENARPTLCFECPIHIFKLPSASLSSSEDAFLSLHWPIRFRSKNKIGKMFRKYGSYLQ